MNPSIRNRLLFTLLPLTFALWVAVAMIIYSATRTEVDQLIDAQLAQSASVLLNLLTHEFHEEEQYRAGQTYEEERSVQPLHVVGHKYEQKVAFQMWLLGAEHRLGLRSAGAPNQPLTDQEVGFSNQLVDGRQWRVYVLTDHERGMQVQVAEGSERRTQLRDNIAARISIPVILSVPLLGFLVWLGVGRAMRPLRTVAREVTYRHPNQLSPISTVGVPLETKPLVDALNSLFQRLEQAFENERRFTADASHELRTPLAALKTQAQVALRATSDEVRREALRQVISGVDRATHLSEQLLALARIDPESWIGGEPLELRGLAEKALAELVPAALAKQIDLGLEEGDVGLVRGDRGMLAILIRNLVDNAVKYTPNGGSVEVRITGEEGAVVLSVADSGPGIPPAERARVFERFYRQLGSGASGSGLGLSIVQRVADLHQAEIRLGDAALGGLLAEVRFPAYRAGS